MTNKLKKIWVFGLGNFGLNLIEKIKKNGNINLQLVDSRESRLMQFKDENFDLYNYDVTQDQIISQLDIDKDDGVIVSLGENIGNSIIVCQKLMDTGNQNIYVRAVNTQHKRILKAIGVPEKNIILPYELITEYIAYNLTYRLDVLMIEEDKVIVSLINHKIKGKNLRELKLIENNIHILLVSTKEKPEKQNFANSETIINEGDKIKLLTDKNTLKKVKSIFGC